MNDSNPIMPIEAAPAPARFERAGPLLMVGLRETLQENFEREIPLLWERFVKISPHISHRADQHHYGLCMKETLDSAGFYYMAGCALSEFVDVPVELSQVIIPSQCFAVFKHEHHVSRVTETVQAIFDRWLPGSGYELDQQATHPLHHLEKYTEAFDPVSGMGGMEIWVPVSAA